MNDDDDPHHASWFNKASRICPPRSGQICLNPVMRVGSVGEHSEQKPETAAHWAKQDADKIGVDARDQTGGLIESCTRLNFSITQLVDFIRNEHTGFLYNVSEYIVVVEQPSWNGVLNFN